MQPLVDTPDAQVAAMLPTSVLLLELGRRLAIPRGQLEWLGEFCDELFGIPGPVE